jgi:hypothetical protein
MLIKPAKEESAVVLDRAAQRESELLLLIVGLEVQKGMGRAEAAVAQKIKITPVELVGSRFRDHVDHSSAGAPKFRSVGIGRDSELLYNLVRELIRRAIAATRLGEECVVVVGAIDQIAGLESAHSAKRQVAIGARSHAPWILRDAGRHQS